MALRRLTGVVRQEGFRRPDPWAGPDREDDCPCGSHRRARSCRSAPDHSWLAEPSPALLRDNITGFANPGCFGRVSRDCAGPLDREHWVSESVQRAIADVGSPITLTGVPWLNGGALSVGTNQLASRILCKRHNNALSPLDMCAEAVIRHLIADMTSLVVERHPDRALNTMTLSEGPMFERWLLKMVWGALASGSIGDGSDTLTDLAPGVDLEQLAAVLWRGAPWPQDCGFYGRTGDARDPTDPPGTLHFEPWETGGGLWGAGVEIFPLRAAIALLPPHGRVSEDWRYRPALYRLHRPGEEGDKALNFCWPEPGHPALRAVAGVRPTSAGDG